MIKYLIAVDAGGTKTEIAAIDANQKIIDKTTTGPGSAAVIKEEVIWEQILTSIDELISRIDIETYQLVAIQMGLSAFSIFEQIEDVKEKLTKKYDVEVYIEGDTIIALHSILKDQYQKGVCCVAGTGIAIYGENENNTCIIGGWGHIIRELGSAYAAVHHFALNIIDNFENNLPLTKVENEFLELLQQNNIKDLKHLFYFHSKTEIASFVPFIKNAALNGDNEAKLLLKEEGKYLGYQVIKAINKLQLKNNYVVGVRGGFVQKQSYDIIEGIKEVLKDNDINVPFICDSEEAIYGCYFLIKKRGLI